MLKIKFKPTNSEVTGSKSGCQNNFILISTNTSSNPPSCACVKAPDSIRVLTMVLSTIFQITSFIVAYVIFA